jgi:uncharacterized protein involved in outer membrane biogenesis
MRKIVVAIVVVLAVALLGGLLLVRSLLDPEHVRQMLERQATGALGQPVTIGHAEPSWWPRAGVTLTGVVVGRPAAITLARTEVSTAMRALISRRIEDAEVSVHDSDLDLPVVLASLERLSSRGGAQAPDGPAAGEGLAKGVTLVNVRAIDLQNVRIHAGSRSAVVDMKSAVDGDRLDIESAAIESDVTSLKATGAIESLTNRKGRLSITANALDLDGLIVFAQEFARHAMPASGTSAAAPASDTKSSLDLVLAIEAARGAAASVPFEQLAATANVTPGGVRIEPLTARVFGGGLQGSIHVDLADSAPAVAVQGALSAVDMTRLTGFAGQPGSVTGTLNGAFSATGRGTDPAQALARARGQGSAAITDGTVKGLQLVRPIVLAFGKPDAVQPAAGGERFSRLSAAYSLASGVVTLRDLSFESRDVEMDGAGTLVLEQRALDIRANARLSKELTAQAGRDLVRYTVEDGRVTVPVTVTGQVESLQVAVNIAGVAERALTNEVKRRTESAIRDLFKRRPPKE